jgi:hypothetical protein
VCVYGDNPDVSSTVSHILPVNAHTTAFRHRCALVQACSGASLHLCVPLNAAYFRIVLYVLRTLCSSDEAMALIHELIATVYLASTVSQLRHHYQSMSNCSRSLRLAAIAFHFRVGYSRTFEHDLCRSCPLVMALKCVEAHSVYEAVLRTCSK